MSVDIERFHRLFFEEAVEHLGALEALTLKLDPAQRQDDAVNAIFRAAHSIKGGAATFGFERLAQMTHALETLLDQVRQNVRPLSAQLVRLLLSANDVLRAHVAALQDIGAADTEAEEVLLLQLQQEAQSPAVAQAVPTVVESEPAAATATSGGSEVVIVVVLNADERGTPEAIKRIEAELSALGTVQLLTPAEQLQQADRVRLSLHTRVNAQEVRESLAFIWDEQRFQIEETAPRQQPETVTTKDLAELDSDSVGFFAENMPEALAQKAQTEHEEVIGRRAYDHGPESAKFGRRQADRFVAMPLDTSSIRVGVEKVDRLVNLVGELVIAQAMLVQSTSHAGDNVLESIGSNLGQLDRNIRELHEAVMAIRMLPISYVFSRFPRVVRDLADKLGKKVELIVEGEETELDKGLIEKMTDPLTHLVRNSVDHGIEAVAKREAVGKSAIGKLRVRASHEGGNVLIEVSDDGCGFDRARLLGKARAQGLAISDTAPDQEVWQLAFLPGLSTAEQVTEVSGRGVGMDVVKRNIEQLGGRLDVSSVRGQGATVTIRLPLTLAILDGMLITVGDHTYVIPLTYILENLQPAAEAVKSVTGQGRVVRVREEYIPLIVLHEALNIVPRRREAHEAMLVICEANGQRAALQVDELVSQGQFVIKSLEQNFRKIAGVAGATILGDGRVALILDIGTLLRTGQRQERALLASSATV